MNTQNKCKPYQISFKIIFLAFLLLFFSSDVFANSIDGSITNKAVDGGIGLGSIIAVVASWSRNKSILYGIIHGLLGWIYVIYFAITRENRFE